MNNIWLVVFQNLCQKTNIINTLDICRLKQVCRHFHDLFHNYFNIQNCSNGYYHMFITENLILSYNIFAELDGLMIQPIIHLKCIEQAHAFQRVNPCIDMYDNISLLYWWVYKNYKKYISCRCREQGQDPRVYRRLYNLHWSKQIVSQIFLHLFSDQKCSFLNCISYKIMEAVSSEANGFTFNDNCPYYLSDIIHGIENGDHTIYAYVSNDVKFNYNTFLHTLRKLKQNKKISEHRRIIDHTNFYGQSLSFLLQNHEFGQFLNILNK